MDIVLMKRSMANLMAIIKNKYGKECYVYEQTYLNNYVGDIVPAKDVVAPSYAKHMNLNHTDTLYIDNPSDLNLKFVVGVPPKANDKYPEIAISKTWYNYFCEVKRFDNSFGEIVDFEKLNLLDNTLNHSILQSQVFVFSCLAFIKAIAVTFRHVLFWRWA